MKTIEDKLVATLDDGGFVYAQIHQSANGTYRVRLVEELPGKWTQYPKIAEGIPDAATAWGMMGVFVDSYEAAMESRLTRVESILKDDFDA